MKALFFRSLVLAVLSLSFLGCAQYQITQPLEQSLSQPVVISVGTIEDQLPPDTPEKKKPTEENIQQFREDLRRYLVKEKVAIGENSSDNSTPSYEVRGSVLSHAKGSGALRFFIGFGAGNAKLTTHLELVQLSTGQVVFGGNFTGEVSDWTEKGDKMWENVAKNFAKALKKQEKNLAKMAKS